MADLRHFDYQKVAQLDADMWRAYYNHQFGKLFLQLLRLTKQQMGVRGFAALRLAFYAGWAAADYRIHKHKGVNNARVVKNLAKFYKIIAQRSPEPFDYHRAAELELAWWDVHRRSYQNNPALERSLTESAATIYNLPVAQLKDYAHYRAQAMILPRHEGDDQSVPTDWQEVTDLLTKSWQSLRMQLEK